MLLSVASSVPEAANGFTGSSNVWINLLWTIGAVLVVLSAVGFSMAYIWASFKKNRTNISSQNIQDYKDRVELLTDELTETKNKLAQVEKESCERDAAQQETIDRLSTQLETFKNYPFEIMEHMKKTNEVLNKMVKRLDSLDKSAKFEDFNSRFDVAGSQVKP